MDSASPGMPSLCAAAMMGKLDIVEELLLSETDINIKAKGDMTPLMLAAMFGHETVVAKLLKFGANAAARNAAGFTAWDLVNMKTRSEYNGPFYDPTYSTICSKRNINQSKDANILKRRNVSLPKINIHICNSEQVNRIPNHHSRIRSDNYRYSPYSKPGQNDFHKKINTPTSLCSYDMSTNLQHLSPTVANFFGNVVKAKGSILSPRETDEVFCSDAYCSAPDNVENSSSPNLINNIILFDNNTKVRCCPILHKILCDYGLQFLVSLFERQEINFYTFVTLTEMDLQQIGISTKHHDLLMKIISMYRSHALVA